MLFVQISIILFLTTLPVEIFSQRISNIKCTDYQNSPQLTQEPPIVTIIMRQNSVITQPCSAVLVSDQFVLSSTQCAKDAIQSYNYAVFSDSEMVPISNVYVYDFDIVPDGKTIPVLFQMRHRINTEYYRPACIWTYNDQPQNQIAVQRNLIFRIFKQNPPQRTSAVEFIYDFHEGIAISAEDCQRYAQVTEDKMCLYFANHTLMSGGQTFNIPNLSGPIIYVASKLVYVTGLLSESYRHSNGHRILTAIRLTSNYIEWIESIVWAEYKTSQLTCGRIQIKHQPFITFGAPTYPGQFPWHVAINRREGFGYKRYICGGTIINNQTILTAAHCVHSEVGPTSPNILTVEVGKFDLNLKSEQSLELQVDLVWPHENFRRDTLENDIAILKLQNFIKFTDFIQPICITNNTNIFDDNIGIVPGWGRNELDTPQVELAHAALPIRTNYECRDSNRNFFTNFLNDFNFCAGYQNGTNVCTGDSGGGLILQKDNLWYIKGIVSLGVSLPNMDRCDPTELVLFTDVVKYYEWIYTRA